MQHVQNSEANVENKKRHCKFARYYFDQDLIAHSLRRGGGEGFSERFGFAQ
jgi:hypothetical protein